MLFRREREKLKVEPPEGPANFLIKHNSSGGGSQAQLKKQTKSQPSAYEIQMHICCLSLTVFFCVK